MVFGFMENQMMTKSEFDFGFSHVDEEEITKPLHKSVQSSDNKLQQMYDAIMPLLTNLKANPEKDMIKWPNRVAKIDEFIKKLDKIIAG